MVMSGLQSLLMLMKQTVCSKSNENKDCQRDEKIRLIGVEHEKSQIIATLRITEGGNVLPCQAIFGGKTDRCRPKVPLASGYLVPHFVSHWQTVETYLDYIKKITITYKDRVIIANRLPLHQKTVLKHDLHYTHQE